MTTGPEYPVSLSKFLSICGVASRRKATELIKNEKVFVNSELITQPGYKVTEKDIVKYNNKVIQYGKRYYILLNKPRGYVCTNEDKYADKKAVDLIDIPDSRLFTAGRLDKESEGMIIVTNDGDYAKKLTHPSYQTTKTYHVTVDRELSKKNLSDFQNGITDDGEFLKAQSVKAIGRNKYEFVLTQGKNREIRRMISYAKRKTIKLKRIAIGRLSLDKLPQGKWRSLSSAEIELTLK